MSSRGHKTTKISRDDIAAMEVIATRHAGFSHHLNTKHIDIKWILDRKNPAGGSIASSRVYDHLSASREGHSAQRSSRAPNSRTGTRTETPTFFLTDKVAQIAKTPDLVNSPKESLQQRSGPDTTPSTAGAPEEVTSPSLEPETEDPPADTSGATDPTPDLNIRLSSIARHRPFFPAPEPLLTLATLDRTQSLEEEPASTILINSPRSTYVILKGGYNVPDLCGVPLHQYYRQALLDGCSIDNAKLRVDSEEERRKQRFDEVLRKYQGICQHASMEQFVNVIREHKYGHESEKDIVEKKLQEIPHYAHPGKLDLTMMDTDCVDVLVRSRDRTLGEIRRVLDQRDRVQRQSIEREKVIYEREVKAEDDTRRVQEQQNKVREEKAREQKEKRAVVAHRVDQLIQAHKEADELKRDAMIQEREVQESRVHEKKKLERSATMAMIETNDRRRKRAKAQQEAILEDKRQKIVEKTELIQRIKEREKQIRYLEMQRKAKDKAKEQERRRLEMKEAADRAQRERERRQEEIMASHELKLQEFEYLQGLRREVKAEVHQQKAARGAYTRANAEAIKQQRMAELEEEYEQKMMAIENLQKDQKIQRNTHAEHHKQMQLEKVEEKERAMNVAEFNYVGYVSGTDARNNWIERDNEKRNTLRTQVKQEREAMIRAKEQILAELDQQEQQRKKEFTTMMM